MDEHTLKARVQEEMKAAMRAKDKQRLGAIRLILTEIKRIEVDERIDPDDARLISVLDKMCKQRRDSIQQYEIAGRAELVAQEVAEITVIQEFLPNQFSPAELTQMVDDAIASTSAESIKDMGKVMGSLKPKLQGRADMGEVSKQIKAVLTA
jgi:uncharacterized protein YqeY